MIFKIHYFCFNAGLSGVMLFISVFIRRYSDASSTEVGTLLMILPFLSVFTKPFFGALADRHQKHKLYLVLGLVISLIGFGSYTILPFFPEFIARHGRLAWCYLVCATVIGQLGYGVVWSLGDALAANLAHKSGESFGNIRLWGTVGWGVAGALVGALGPLAPQLPEMVPGLLVFVATNVFEIILLCWWPSSRGDFEMGGGGSGSGEDDNDDDNGQKARQVIRNLTEKHIRNELENEKETREKIASLQWTLFKMVALKNKSIFKYLLIFTVIGAIFNIHFSYFFLHLERLATSGAASAHFSSLVGMCVVAQAVGETFCFVIAPWVVLKLGRDGAISLNLVAYIVRYFGNGLAIPLVSPFAAVFTELLQGINYGIFYYLITNTALYYALQVDQVLPELRRNVGEQQKWASSSASVALRTSLRATMQGVFSGAFDGLGFGLGSIVAGVLLERHSYEQLWCATGSAAAAMFALHALSELATRLRRRRHLKKQNNLAGAQSNRLEKV